MRLILAPLLAPLLAALAGPLAAGDVQDVALQQVEGDPGPFLALAAQVIAAQGEGGRIGPAGIDRFITLERAMARVAALRLQLADGDLDGMVTRDEMAARLDMLAQAANSRLWGQFQAADGDGDGILSGGELSAFGHVRAEQAMPETEAALARLMLGFDGDGDGLVSLEEIEAGVSALGT
jgi:EF hand